MVIAIIAILAAILLPSLQEARYRARLTLCMNNLHQNGIALVAYTQDHSGRFPIRWDSTNDIGTNGLTTLAQLGPYQNRDLRVELGTYTQTEKTFLCPFVKPVDLTLVAPRLEVDCSYNMWFGWPPETRNSTAEISPGCSGTLRFMEDEITCRGRKIAVLMGDMEAYDNHLRAVRSSHPAPGLETPSTADGIFIGSNQRVFSFYYGFPRESFLDLNFLFTDGHVELFRDVKRVSGRRVDRRMIDMKSHWGRTSTQIPPSN